MKKTLVILFIITLTLGVTGCDEKDELKTILKEKNYTIVDVRTEEEYNEGHVKKAINIPYDTINKKTSLNKNKTILVYCQSGKRSSIAYNILKKLGYDVYDLGAYNTIKLDKE
ncbi:MAG: rhodanese-like domain-containing protein [Bacilli bacterium]|nr:rhodanese-like domain-containing protein [Bacilli bacterium]